MSQTTVGRLATLPLSVLLMASLSACSGSDDDSAGQTPEEIFAAAAAKLSDTAGIDLDLTTSDLPKGVNGLVSAKGRATDAPAFEGTVKLSYSGLTPEVPVVAVDGKVFATLPFTSAWTEIDPSEYQAPDPALLVGDEGFGHLLGLVESPEKGKSVRGGTDNKEVLTTFTATVPGAEVKRIMPSADESDTFDATFQFDDSDEVRRVELTGVFYAGEDSMTYTVDFSHYSATASPITKP